MTSERQVSLGPIMTTVAGPELTAVDRERLLHPGVGGVVLFAHNVESTDQVRALTGEIHALQNPPLLIAIDQEGGRVQRIKTGVTLLPAQRRYGDLYDENQDLGNDAAEMGAYIMASQLLELGIDISFSPVLDIGSANSQVIGDRAFHSSPQVVTELAQSWTRGMQKAGMQAVGKHFPGHGHVQEDSHYETPEDNRQIQEVLACDLLPYRRLSTQLAAVMTAHVLYPHITSAIPTYSSFWLDHVLREALSFYGVVFSDDLSMQAAAEAGDMETRVLTAIGSGCDIVLICQSLEETDAALAALEKSPKLWREVSWQYEKLRPGKATLMRDFDRLHQQFAELFA